MKKILAIDDQIDNLTTIKAVVKSHIKDCEVLTALSGKEGIKIAKEEQPDTILLDIIMPEMDGYETCEILKKDRLTKHIPVVMVTAIKTDSESRVKGLNIGADAFLAKPIDAIELSAQVKVMLRIKEAEDSLRLERNQIDIEFNKSVDQLRKSEEKNRLIVENSPYCIHQLNASFSITSMNPFGLSMIGAASENDILGTHYLDFVSDPDKDRIENLLQKALSGKKTEFEYRAVNDQVYSSSFIPIKQNDVVALIMGITQDITVSKLETMKQAAELRLIDYARDCNTTEFLQKLLDEVEVLTRSKVGFFHFVKNDQVSLSLQAWSTNTLEKMCSVEGEDRHYEISKAGVWVDCIHEKKAVIHNNYENLPHKKGLPEGHAPIIRELVVPVIRGKKIMAVMGVGNKNTDYNQQDIELVQSLADTAWETVELKKAEEALKESEEKFKAMIINSPDLILIQDPDGKLVYSSPQSIDVIGHDNDKFLNNNFLDYIHPDDKEHVYKTMISALEGEDINNCEYRFLGEKGEINWLSQSARAIRTNGKITSIQSNVTNINIRKLANEELLKHQHYLSKAQEIGNIGTWELDIQKNILRWTDENYRIFDVPIGTEMNYELFQNCIHPDDLDYVHSKWSAALEGEPYDIEHRLIVDSKIKWVREKADIEFDDKGNPIIAIGVTQDITKTKLIEKDLKDREKQYRQLFDLLPYGGEVINTKGIVVNCSPSTAHMLGYGVSDIIGKHITKFLSRESAIIFKNKFHILVSGKATTSDITMIGKDGKEINVLRAAQPILDDNGKVVAVLALNVDVSERKRSEEALIESEERFKTMFESAPDAIYVNDTKGVFLEGNLAAEEILGYKKEELIGKTFLTLGILSRKDLTRATKLLAKNVMGKKTGPDEFTLIREDGSKVSAEVSTFPARFNNKNVILGIARDITERKKSGAALEESEEKYRNLVERANDGISIIQDGIIKFANSSLLQMYGSKLKDVIGKPFTEFIHPEELHQITKYYKLRLKGENVPHIYETSLKNKKGRRVYAELSAGIIKYLGKPADLVIIRDITDRKLTEKELTKLSTAVEQSPSVIIITGLDGKIEYINPKFTELTGYTSAESIGQLPNILKSGEQTGEIYKELWETISSGKDWHGEFHNKKKDGGLFWESASVSPIIDNEGKITNYLKVAEDISERKNAEEAYKESERKYRDTVNLLPQIVYEIDTNGILTYINDLAIKQTGYSREEFENKFNVLQVILPEQRDRAQKSMQEKMLKDEIGDPEYTLLRKDGSTFPVLLYSNPILKNNKPVGMRGIIIDNTERKQGEESLKESERRFKSLMHQSPFVVEIYDIEGLQVSVNKAYEELWGFPADTTVNIFNVLKSKEVETSGLMEYVKRAYNGESVSVPEYTFDPTGDTEAKGLGRVRWLSTKIYPIIGTTGKVKNIVIVHQDISEQKRAEQIQKVLFNISNTVTITDNLKKLIGIIQTELGTIIDTTNFYVALCDQDSDTFSFPFYADEKDYYESAPIGKTLTNYVIVNKKPLLANLQLKKKFVKEGKLSHQGSLSKIWLGVPLIIDDKAIGAFALQSYTDEDAYNESDVKMLEFVSDQISLSIHRKKSEDDVKAALIKAEESDRLKSAFLANMSHEIRTPMNGILGFASLLNEPKLTGVQLKKYVAIIEKSGARMLNIINDLIDISKIEAGQMEVNITEGNINEQIEYLYTFFNPEAIKKELILSYNNQLSNTESIIATDREKVYAILTNLIKNSIKYTHEGNIEFGYKKTGNFLEFFIKDTGIGIPKDRLDAVFERFVQADIEDSNVYEGAGLGLTITKAYVEMLGGQIWVESVDGKGSQFYFTIPYSPIKKKTKVVRKGALHETTIPMKKLKILIAEDEDVAANFLSIILKEHSTDILIAKTGKETVELSRDNPDIDVILMDIKMPIISGYEATKQIRKFNKDVIIIAQTAYALSGDHEKAIEAGCNDYISKPINKDELMEMIKGFNFDV